MANPLDHFAVLTVDYRYFDTNFPITVTTNNPCHLWLRWSVTVPQKHINEVIVRGAPIGTYIDQCFVAFKDIEQTEFYDTLTHTFYSPAWPPCQRRWFYFHGTVGGIVSPSASPIFTKHRPYTDSFYSDPASGATTCDGTAFRYGVSEPFATLHAAPGKSSNTIGASLYTSIRSWWRPNMWNSLERALLTFDLRTIDPTHKIQAATLYVYSMVREDTQNLHPRIALFNAFPAAFNDVVPADYQAPGSWRLTNEISYDDWHLQHAQYFNFINAALAYIQLGKLNAFALRESRFDAPASSPPWTDDTQIALSCYSADHPTGTWRPRLYIAHAPLNV